MSWSSERCYEAMLFSTTAVNNFTLKCNLCQQGVFKSLKSIFIKIKMIQIRGSPILFSWLCVKREWGFIFSVIRESIHFLPRETGFRFFFVIREICFYFRVIFEPTTFAGIIFHFFEDNYSKLDVKPAHSRSLRMEDWELTLEGLESAIMDRSLGTNLHIGVFAHTSNANTTSPT